MSLSRRWFLKGTGVAAVGAALPFSFMFQPRARAGGFGPLRPDPDGVLDLPEGFSYQILERALSPMDDGYRVPGRPDGMACFPGAAGTLVLMRNHENSALDVFNGPYNFGQSAPAEAYDAGAMGGVTRLVLDATTFERVSSNLVLVGTLRNCAGGVSPWGWLTCEEDVGTNHGYVFLCDPAAATVQAPQLIRGYGRFNHEAATVDPATNICYLTEDRGDSCLYRFVPNDPAEPFSGKLQALKVVGRDVENTASGKSVGDSFEIEWVDIDTPDPGNDVVRSEAQGKGGAVFARGEGIWFHDGAVYICSTSGGPVSGGQIFKLTPAGDGGVLQLIAQSEDRDVLDMPDNITVSPAGELYVAEDGAGDQYVRGIGADGAVFDFARNAGSTSEICGVCFSPDGKAMFLNIQGDGLTIVVTGPFPAVDPDPDPDPDPGAPDAGTGDPDPMSPDAGGGNGGGGNGGGDDGGGANASDGGGCSAGGGADALGVALATAAATRLARSRDPDDA